MSVDDRKQLVIGAKLCLNCLRASHFVSSCPVQDVCRKCGSRHHTLIHGESNSSNKQPKQDPNKQQSTVQSSGRYLENNGKQNTGKVDCELATTSSNIAQCPPLSLTSSDGGSNYVFLATVQILVGTKDDNAITVRALLDSGSQLNFISKSLASKLDMQPTKKHLSISGIGGNLTSSSGAVNIKVKSRIGNFSSDLEAHVMRRITYDQPSMQFVRENLGIPSEIELADPMFYNPGPIDLLIGNDLVYDINLDGRMRMANGITLQNTTLGWIVAGKCNIRESFNGNLISAGISLKQEIERFWRIDEDLINVPPTRTEENSCEQHFIKTYQRNDDGRFILRLPFCNSVDLLGDSSGLALKRFLNLEKRLERDASLKAQYCSFIDEYIRLGHMQVMPRVPECNFYLPHFAVVNSDSSSTKLRVVFDGSAKSSSGISLNQILMVGPVIQSDLVSVLLRFRSHAWVISADIVKMYRQFLLHPSDRCYQCIYWRRNSNEPVQTYQLNTVTYGLAPASFMATRCLQELVVQFCEEFPKATECIQKDCYIDNLLTGSNSPVELSEIKSRASLILESAGMDLKKWGTNNSELLQTIANDDREACFSIDGDELVKVLGLLWSAEEDSFKIKVQSNNFSNKLTKRSVISDVAKIFDPLGLIAPVVVLAKILMQQLWSLKIGWDVKLPSDMQEKWLSFRDELSELHRLKVPRHLFDSCTNPKNIQLHCFADASERGYGGCIYVRCFCENKVLCRLVCSKSRIAPKGKTIPKLELCAAELVVKMAAKYIEILNYHVEEVYYWSDSTIVLHWINTPVTKLEVFVANRIRTIQHLTARSSWYHVDSKANPADIVSRGMRPSLLISADLWWNGPEFLLQDAKYWNSPFMPVVEMLENMTSASAVVYDIFSGLHHRNSFNTLQFTFGLVMRFINNLRCKDSRKGGRLSLAEVSAGHDYLIRAVQLEAFGDDVRRIFIKGAKLKNKCLRSLAAFKDEKGLIRVGGRLKYSDLQYSCKHPLVLPTGHFVTTVIVNSIHNTHLHVGPQGLLAAVRQRYWPILGRKIVKSVVNNCMVCSRAKPKMLQQFMGDLPKDRVTQSFPFHVTGVDYCGPIYIYFNIRGKGPSKAYLATFVCCITRAVHLELVSDLSTNCFMGALRRFVATRGLPAKIISDNGRNFVGANNQLRELANLLASTNFDEQIQAWCLQARIEWKFAPPGSPHFGGIYEAAVKAAKFHLKRITHNSRLTFEQMTTVIKQIESVLNSRPIVPLMEEDVIQVLTPGHFLVGRPLTSLLETSHCDDKLAYSQKWAQVNKMYKTFWSRWTTEYLNELQKRNYWQSTQPNLKTGMMVIMHDPNLPPLQWKFGIIIAVHPGKDGLVRVVTIRTANGEFTRSITKVSLLPIDVEVQSIQGGENDNANK